MLRKGGIVNSIEPFYFMDYYLVYKLKEIIKDTYQCPFQASGIVVATTHNQK